MATRKLATVLAAALALVLLSAAALLAAGKDPGRGELNSNDLRIPIIRGDGYKPHSDGWNAKYLDRHAATELRITAPVEKQELTRGGLAENYSPPRPSQPKAVPVISKRGYLRHSDEWNAQVLDRYATTRLPVHGMEPQRAKQRGGPVE